MTVPSSTTEPAATSEPAPITARLSTVADMPIRQSSSIVHPCSTAAWPTLTRAPTVAGIPSSTCTVTLSCRLVSSPMLIASMSPRSTAP